jgi:glycerol-3-phosphate acyltransferase PlsY
VVGLVYALVWLAVMGLTRTSSLGGLSAAVSAPIAAALTGHADLAAVLALLAALVVFQHRANISRLLAGTEPRFGGKKTANADG